MTTQVSLVDFYKRHGISPVRQDISNLEAHFTRRAALYRHLGLLPLFVRGKRVLEIGPGSGFNSLYTATLRPAHYVLLEGNPAGVADIERLFADFGDLKKGLEIVTALIDDYKPQELFDIVLCEGVLGLAGVPNPAAMLRSVADFVAPGGVLVITCIDEISYFSETLRRLLADIISPPSDALEQRVEVLAPVFGAHLARLGGVSRRYDDWVIDNLINPASIGPLFSIPEAIAAVSDAFDVFGASPRFLTDWRWYKSIVTPRGEFNDLALEEYWRTAHNLLDCRSAVSLRAAESNRRMYDACASTRSDVRTFEKNRAPDVLARIQAQLFSMAGQVDEFQPPTAAAIRDAAALASRETPATRVRGSEAFGAWFGRGQQYLSFSRI